MRKDPLKTLLMQALVYLEAHQDEGPAPEGWQSVELRMLIAKIRTVVSQ